MILVFIGTTELILIGGMALLLFGGKKLPEMMRGIGKGVKEFKSGLKEDDMQPTDEKGNPENNKAPKDINTTNSDEEVR